jgi:group I intron endonuclease
MKIIGIIYKVTNKFNNKSYIGKTQSKLSKRKSQHLRQSLKESNKNNKFYNAIKKYGKDSFEWNSICTCVTSKEDLCELEKYFINIFDSYYNGYNSTFGGDSSGGFKHKKETIEKIRLNSIKQFQNAEQIKKAKLSHIKIYEDNPELKEKARIKAKKQFSNPLQRELQSNLKNHIKKKVICIQTGQIFNSINECASFFNTQHSTIKRVIKQIYGHKSYKGLTFAFSDL